MEKVDKHVITASDYSIYLKSVPPQTTEQDLKRHFEAVLNNDHDNKHGGSGGGGGDMVGGRGGGGGGGGEQQQAQQIGSLRTPSPPVVRYKVAAVSIVEDNGPLIKLYQRRGKVVRRRNRAR